MTKQAAAPNLRALATHPLAPFKHERIVVPEWNNATVIVRQLVAGDWVDYRAAIAKAQREALKSAFDGADEQTQQLYKLSRALTVADEFYQRVGVALEAEEELPDGFRPRARNEVRRLAAALAEAASDAPAVVGNVIPATALVLVRTLFNEDGTRVLHDEDVAAVAASFSDVHARLVDKAFELSGITLEKPGPDGEPVPVDPVAEAGNA